MDADYKGQYTKPPTEAPAYKKPVDAWIISCGQASAGCSTPAAEMKKASEALGWKATVVDGNFGVGDGYNVGFRQAIAAEADVILTIGVSCDQAEVGLKEAKSAGIIVVGADSFDCSDPKVHVGKDLMSGTVLFNATTPTAADAERARGQARADWIITHTKGRAKVINLSFTGLAAGEYNNDGFVEEMKKCSTCSIVKTIEFTPADSANGTLKQAFASALAQHPEANAAPVTSDGIITSAGLAQDVQSAGRTKDFVLVGGEGYAVNNGYIRDGRGQGASVTFDSNWLAWGAVDTALRLLAGQKAVPEGLGIQMFDKDHGLPAAGQDYSASVDFRALYEQAWGVS